MQTESGVPTTAAICRFQAADGSPSIGWFDGKLVHDLSASGA
ncbi:MAG: hypothetical protein JWO42_2075, partial [Chloroflexi bacterium]|nr:hypothetical protein [Chloroflexota bacterium]